MKESTSRDEQLAALLRSEVPPEYEHDFMLTLRDHLVTVEQEPPSRKSSHKSRKRMVFVGGARVVTAAAVVVAVALIATNTPTDKPGGIATSPTSTAPQTPRVEVPDVLLASQVIERTASKFASAKSMTGRALTRTSTAQTTKSFVLTSKGDFYVRGAVDDGQPVEEAYDATTHKYISSYADMYFSATGPSDGGIWAAPSSSIDFLRQVAWSLDALAADNSTSLAESEVDGRKTWKLTSRTDRTTPLYEPDELSVEVDQQTSFPVSVLASRQGGLLYDVRMQDVKIDAPIDQAFTVSVPKGASVSDAVTFNQVELDKASAKAGYAVPRIGFTPDGFELSAPQYAKQYLRTEESSGGQDIVSQTLRKGFATVNVSTSRIPDYAASPFRLIANAEIVRSVRLTSGVYSGVTVQLVQPGVMKEHVLWGIKNGIVFVVSGNASDDDLLEIANGLHS